MTMILEVETQSKAAQLTSLESQLASAIKAHSARVSLCLINVCVDELGKRGEIAHAMTRAGHRIGYATKRSAATVREGAIVLV